MLVFYSLALGASKAVSYTLYLALFFFLAYQVLSPASLFSTMRSYLHDLGEKSKGGREGEVDTVKNSNAASYAGEAGFHTCSYERSK